MLYCFTCYCVVCRALKNEQTPLLNLALTEGCLLLSWMGLVELVVVLHRLKFDQVMMLVNDHLNDDYVVNDEDVIVRDPDEANLDVWIVVDSLMYCCMLLHKVMAKPFDENFFFFEEKNFFLFILIDILN